MKTQDPKYDIEDGRLVNAATRVPIPEDEPIFILRAQDRRAAATLWEYWHDCVNLVHRNAVYKRLTAFRDFAERSHPERMKEPDTAEREA